MIKSIDDAIKEIVDRAPPLTQEQRDRLGFLLTTGKTASQLYAAGRAMDTGITSTHAPWEDNRPTSLYRYFDQHVLVYVGITCNPISRDRAHQKHSHWWSWDLTKTVETYPDRTSAERAEIKAIKAELPLYNVMHNPLRGITR